MPGSGEHAVELEVRSLWARLDNLIRQQTGLEELPFQSGCTDDQLRQLEDALGVQLSGDYRALLRCANGQREAATQLLTFPPKDLTYLDTESVLREWTDNAEFYDDESFDEFQDHDRVRRVLYHPRRIPIALNVLSTTTLFLDYVPGPSGRVGQLVINVDEFECEVVEDGILALLQRYLDVLESGAVRVQRESPELGEGYRFMASGHYLDMDLYKELRS